VSTARLSVPVWDSATGVLVQSPAIRARVLEAVRAFRPAAEARVAAKIEVVPNGIALPDPVPALPAPAIDRAGDREAVPGGRAAGRIHVLSVGRLIFDKGMDVVIEAVAAARGHLTIAGDGPERERLAARAQAGAADVCFEGAVPRERLDRLYREADVVVLASRRGEGMPNVLLEAFAYGRPVVATPVGGVTDLVVDGANGLVVPAGDARALAEALRRLRVEAGLAERLRSGARRTAEGYAWECVLPRLEDDLARWARS
jgi:glycosyltransferase involved in cell wall biosynthesis